MTAATTSASAGMLLIGSSTMPYGRATAFTVTAPHAASGWLLCDLATNKSVAAGSGGSATWSSAAEKGSLLVFGAKTQCH
jgi:hypothetical protein